MTIFKSHMVYICANMNVSVNFFLDEDPIQDPLNSALYCVLILRWNSRKLQLYENSNSKKYFLLTKIAPPFLSLFFCILNFKVGGSEPPRSLSNNDQLCQLINYMYNFISTGTRYKTGVENNCMYTLIHCPFFR